MTLHSPATFMQCVVLSVVVLFGCFSVDALQLAPTCSNSGNCTAVIRSAIDACPRNGCLIQLLPGVYRMHTNPITPIEFEGLGNVTFEGLGQSPDDTTLLLDGLSFVFSIGGSAAVTLRNFNIDMDRVPFTAGTVMDPVAGKVSVSTKHFGVSKADQAKFSYLSQAQAVIGYDPSTEMFLSPERYTISKPYHVSYSTQGSEPNTATMTVEWGSYRPPNGTMVVVRHQVYSYNCINAQHSSDITVDRVVMYACGGMGVVAIQNTNVRVLQSATMRKTRSDGTKREMSITADGIHVSDSRGGFVEVRNCTLEGQGDDGVNINSRFSRIEQLLNNGKAIIPSQGPIGSPQAVAKSASVGGTFDLFDGRTMRPIGVSPPISGINTTSAEITFASPIGAPLYTLMVLSNGTAQSTLIEGTRFLNNRARGALVKQPNAIVRNSFFSGMTSPAVLTQVDGCYWFEGRPISNWTMTHNTFAGPIDHWGAGSFEYILAAGEVPVFDKNGVPTTTCTKLSVPGIFSDVVISENRFDISTGPPTNAAIRIYATENLQVLGNSISTEELPKARSSADVFFESCSKIDFTNNTCSTKSAVRPCVQSRG